MTLIRNPVIHTDRHWVEKQECRLNENRHEGRAVYSDVAQLRADLLPIKSLTYV
jgi:hypothetical protein